MRLPRIRAIGPLSFAFNCTQVVIRFGSIILSLGALAYIAWLYNYWRSEPTTQVDALFPSFFPLIVGVLVDSYELVALLWLNRTRALNPVAVGFDIALTGTSVFCFLILSMVEREPGRAYETARRLSWASDMRNAMIYMIVVSIFRVASIVMACVGIIRTHLSAEKAGKAQTLARNQAEIVGFSERRRNGLAPVGPIMA
ncbi:hypothetical protein QBC42DRAFT_47428 [Cladorrhinum samala]|uniref:MARVEL domain-containing protein n=1 Tax=Cladorrhinum samala TaxID=585594 RepID=A0AAV9HB50_9PEZI|nr:hypothetical protein QBC42DRAFT_47428 [Cladorrhinum samala]